MRSLILLVAASIVAAAEPPPIELVVRGDDFGYTHASNLALQEALATGIMTSVSALVPGPWFAETARILAKHPEASVGVHLTITSEWNTLRWRPVSPINAVPSLVAPDGYLWGGGYRPERPVERRQDDSPWASHAPNLEEVEREFRAQIERAREMGVRLDYVDCHMGMACREDTFPITQKLAKEYCLGISNSGMYGLQRPPLDYPDDTPAGIRSGLETMLRALKPGRYLYVDHPAVDTPELRAVDTNVGEWWALRRSSILAAWMDPAIQRLVDELGIRLVSMGALVSEESCAGR